MPSLVVLGARGFLGRALIAEAASRWPVKAVSRRAVTPDHMQTHVRWYQAEATNAGELASVLEPGDIVANLAFDANADAAENVAMADGVIEACRRSRVARLVHCSTAIVLGRSSELLVKETTPCVPLSRDERTKWDVELRMAVAAASGLDVVIVRPTVIIGPGGKNLADLARSLRLRAHVRNYLRGCLFGRRPMHLVPVRHVAAALMFLGAHRAPFAGDVFLVSADDEAGNDYRTVERVLRRGLALPERRIPRVRMPTAMLSAALFLRGRSDTKIDRVFDATKLREMGFASPQTVVDAVHEVGVSLRGMP